MSLLSLILNALVFVLILSFLVVIHELGHFLAARWKKIRVEEFGLGYPPRAKTLFTKWNTIFSLNWIPFGGFVRMEGEDELPVATKSSEKKKSKDSIGPFYSKSATARLIVILAGATINVLFGIAAFAIVFSILGIPGGAIIAEIAPDSPAAAAELPVDSVITSLNTTGDTHQIRSSGELVAVVNDNVGEDVVIVTQEMCGRDFCPNSDRHFLLQLRAREELTETKRGLGIAPRDFFRFYPWYEMPFRGMWFGFIQALTLGVLILQSLGTMVSDLVTKAIVPQEVMGPVGIVHEATKNDMASQGPLAILLFTGLISINLGIMNILPIPALDGGRAIFILLEKILGKARIQHIEQYANYGGYAVLLTLIFLVTARDIFRIVMEG